jgi:uncharacterized membrane protein YfcA
MEKVPAADGNAVRNRRHPIAITAQRAAIQSALQFIFRILGRKAKTEENMPKGPVRAALGSGLGAFSSLLGIGGGTPAILIMTMSGVNMHRAVATAAGFGTIIAVPGAIGSMIAGFGQSGLPTGSVGFVNLIALFAITAMSIWTAPLGAAAAHKLDPLKLKRVFGGYLLLTSAFMLKDLDPGRRDVGQRHGRQIMDFRAGWRSMRSDYFFSEAL